MPARSNRLAFPACLESDEGGSVVVSFPDIPEVLTEGASEQEALVEAEDCLAAALGGYIKDRRDIPQPTSARGRPLVSPPLLIAAKTTLYIMWRECWRGISSFAKELGTTFGRRA